MPFDASIYQQQAPDLIGGYARGLDMKDVMQGRQRKQATREAFSQNMEGGKLNRDKTLQALMAVDPQVGMEFQSKMQADDANKISAVRNKMSLTRDLLATVSDESSYQSARAKAIGLGVATEQDIPNVYDQSWVDHRTMKLATAQQQLEQRQSAAATEKEESRYQEGQDWRQKQAGVSSRRYEEKFDWQKKQAGVASQRYEEKFEEQKRQAGISEKYKSKEFKLKEEKAKREGKKIPKAPTGYRYKYDGTLEPIPGGPAAGKKEKSQAQAAKTAQLVVQDIGRTLEHINESMTASGAVVGTTTKLIPGSPAWQTDRMLESVKANIGFDKLQAMRAASPTGGALGQVSDAENKLLQATAGNLDAGLPTEMLQANLQRLYNQYNDVIHGPGNGPQRYELPFDERGQARVQQPRSAGGIPPANAVQSAPAGPQGTTVIQNGIEYNWNPQSGQYE